MRFQLEAPFRNPGGKISKKHCTIIWAKKRNGTLYTQIQTPSTVVTAGMLAQRAKFKNASDYATDQMTDIQKRAAAEQRFNAQTRYLTLRTYLIAESMAGNEVS